MSLKSFTASIDASFAKLDTNMDSLLRRVTMVVAENTIVGGEFSPGTPVDTGFARASWWLSINTESGTPGEVGQSALDAMLATIPEIKNGDLVYLMNNAAYIEVLEDGWSDQAPQGFIEMTVRNGQLIVDRVVEGLQQP